MFWEPEKDGKSKIKINHAREREEEKEILKTEKIKRGEQKWHRKQEQKRN
jgi:hypothetical protein